MADREKAIRILEGNYKDFVLRHNGEFLTVNKLIALLKEQKSEWLEDSDPGQEYGTTWACRKCMHTIHKPFIWNPYDSGYKYCPHCGAEMKVKFDD